MPVTNERKNELEIKKTKSRQNKERGARYV